VVGIPVGSGEVGLAVGLAEGEAKDDDIGMTFEYKF
jgi:hypothetical protein